MKDQNSKCVTDMPKMSNMNNFWRMLWSSEMLHNEEAPWITILEKEHCVDAHPAENEITDELLEKVIGKMVNNKPGKDLVTGLWIKNYQQ